MPYVAPRSASPRTVSPLRVWLTEFLLIRRIYREPAGVALYRYQVTPNEFRELAELLCEHRAHAFHPTYGASWAAAFCLFVAESFRRQYDTRDGGWSWAPFEKALDCRFTPQQHGELVRVGLAQYWKRPIRQYQGGRDNLLGSLFTEGGLPWPLVQSDTHGFGRVVRKGLKYFYRTEAGLRTAADLLTEFEHELPQTFRTLETRQLLAGIVEQLMSLATRYELRGKDDPAQYLDTVEPNWRHEFPLPLDEVNARGLINDWLRDASRRREERESQRASAGTFACGHRLIEGPHGWRIRSEVTVPRLADLSIDASIVNYGRFELAFFEGDRLLARAGAAYGQKREDSTEVSVRFLKTQFSLDRAQLKDELTLRLLSNGSVACIVPFDQGSLDAQELPLVFENKGDEWWFIASASCSSDASTVRVLLPKGLSYTCDGPVSLKEEADGVRWIEAGDSLKLISEEGDRYAVTLKSGSQLPCRLTLKGVLMHYDSVPQVVYQGWPRLDVSVEGSEARASVPAPNEFADRQRVTRANSDEQLGAIHYSAREASGDVLLQRRFGVVPPGFAIQAFPGSGGKPARLVVKQSRQLELQAVDHTIRGRLEARGRDTVIWLESLTDPVPSFLTLEVRGRSGCALAPIRFRVAYPYEGARLIGVDGATLSTRDFTLSDLLGLRVALSTSLPGGTRFCLRLELVSGEARCTRHYYLGVSNNAVLLSLFSYQTDMMQMFGAVDDQDAFLRVSVETDRPLLRFQVRRYNGAAKREDAATFWMTSPSGGALQTEIAVEAMLLTDPRQASVDIPELTTQGVGTGRFRTPLSMHADGPWLIYPASSSPTQFRPFLHLGERSASIDAASEIHSLHAAARAYHPVTQPHVIAQQITHMAFDLDHSGWQYLADLKQHYHHLPLSVFEAWLALSRNPAALAIAVFRLEMDESFCARIRDELAVIWECIPLPQWAVTYGQFGTWLNSQGLPPALSASVLQNRRLMLPHVLESFDEGEMGRYLETSDAAALRRYPIEIILPCWYQQLRRTHESNDHWPTELGHLLREWLARQKLPPPVLTLSTTEFTDAVTILPIFMAYVTAGLETIDELKGNRSNVKFAIKMVSDFDRCSWYAPAHGLMVSYLLATGKT
ncbi:STY4851/ECs_5259 family protein [Paraburkholderia diazotrophica]|uniref:Uncharacterized protein n=1 Tax=Paraburkholderia diazotrophica TaxID=667676 RepID=A0A1H7CP62_9BURK|nr:STY4851/ECs_5259 family protein [Paraburkholderia diazotrophica]SEJ91014.1 hypothetical protein SAMN05192539_102322 [Paraburkholderia diazotrophica]